eukprot:1295346-Prymnesium_polylepis.1
MSGGAMTDLAGEVVAQLDQLHATDRYPLYLQLSDTKLGVRQRGARLMYVLQLPALSRDVEQVEIFFELTNVDDAINLFIAKTRASSMNSMTNCLQVSMRHDKRGSLFSTFVNFGSEKFDVAQSEAGCSLRCMLSTIRNAHAVA